MKYILHFSVIILYLFLHSCRNSEDRKMNAQVTQHCNHPAPVKRSTDSKLKIKGDRFFILDDSLVVTAQSQVQYLPKRRSLAVLDSYFSRIAFFDVQSGKQNGNIIFKKEDIPHKIDGFLITEQNSILLFNYSEKYIYTLDSKGSVTNVVTMLHKKKGGMLDGNPSPNPCNASPFHLAGDTLTFTGYLYGEHDLEPFDRRFIRGKVDLLSGDCISDIIYPNIYRETNWGGDYYRIPYTCYLEDGTSFISLPAEHMIMKVERSGKLSYVNGGPSQRICVNSMGFRKEMLKHGQRDDLILKHYQDNYSYKNIMYLSNKQRIIRILELPNTSEAGALPVTKKSKLLIFNPEFEFMDETILPEDLSTDNYFITTEGIFFLNLTNKDENKAHYTLLSFD
ncbi:hypothetical protein RYH73_19455 [Olivibacter sp. CPCC 100613]|uniref:hypothetical protein n=1 Tax=Olivibacter sp. CPCC 100613 TaxID=3079931 RepID=UPI002FF5E224